MNARFLTIATACLIAPSALAGAPYTIAWSTIDGGGGTTAANGYTLAATVGQPDASAPISASGSPTLTGGFWPGLNAGEVGCNPADLAEPFSILDLADINAFVSGFVNQQPISDVDANGIFDLADINAFVGAFVRGCP